MSTIEERVSALEAWRNGMDDLRIGEYRDNLRWSMSAYEALLIRFEESERIATDALRVGLAETERLQSLVRAQDDAIKAHSRVLDSMRDAIAKCQWCGAEPRLYRHVRGTKFAACNEHRSMIPQFEDEQGCPVALTIDPPSLQKPGVPAVQKPKNTITEHGTLIDISKARKTCQICQTTQDTTAERRVKNENFAGGCGDSFCWASCDSDTCKTREFIIRMCDTCATTTVEPEAGPEPVARNAR